jgi:ribosomal protein L29
MKIMFSGDAPRPEDVLGSAEKFYGMAVLELERTIDAISAGEFNEVKAAQTAIRDLRATAQLVLQERGKVDQLRKQIAGHVGSGGALDLDEARAEIGRRLACLRSAGGGG